MDRRKLLAVAIGTAGAAAAVGVVGVSQAMTTTAQTTAATDPIAVEPAYGAGLFDVDPDQGDISQDPNVSIAGDVAALPEDMEF